MALRPIRRMLGWLLAPAALALALGGCNTPTVPLPPPDPNEFSIAISSNPGSVTMVGMANPRRANARYELFDELSGIGVIVRGMPDGSFTSPPLVAVLGDRLDISYELGNAVTGEVSGILCVVVREGRLSESDRCP